MNILSDIKTLHVNKRNRIKKKTPKKHQINHEFGRSTKTLWTHIVEKSKGK